MNLFNAIKSEPTKPSESPPPEWARRMREDYQARKSCRIEDVRRVLGDQTQATVGGGEKA